ncbi:MAG: SpoIID/LytB domain-containing protein [Candidatus Ventricola sp.]|nr:SpoIID/LytB domain-containing protein [Candidatus Ventricola sp.]
MVQTKRLAALLLTLLALLPVPAAWAESGVVSGTTVSGTVRVYLSSIASNTSVDVTVDGSYSIGGDASRAIPRGARLTVQNSGGTLLLTLNGQTQTMGSRFKLRRHQTSGNNGVYIAQARKPQSLYPGDIEFIAKGGNVQIVVHVYMEDYMRGVLPYEMDNSFPLEALKAQAVAARTYALKKMSAQAATYDVVDTTSDQVYNGTPSGNERCAQAVQETSGIVGTVNGEYMASYYTASNGGQTESVANAWGSGSYSYLQVKDDPYDLRNSASVAKSVSFYRDGTTSVSALTALLQTEAAALLGVGSVSIEGITRVTPHSPRYAAPSRVYTKLDVGMKLAGYGEVTVTLDYFSQVEGLCGLSINTLKNETIEVTETVGGFKLTARRYGHGVGMSQRGAQQMAAEGMTYDHVLISQKLVLQVASFSDKF